MPKMFVLKKIALKKFKIEYLDKDSGNLDFLRQSFPISGLPNTIDISFFSSGVKATEFKTKNIRGSGIIKDWHKNSKNAFFQNWKKYREQGSKISFK